ncbi:spore germination protein [Paenibacillus sp. GYB004]|uniref:spore germination protein n=1 Tax=Paenibacillus sp. GYB004 TaxID=2994393 RepID=UPI003FA69594
MRLLHKLKRLFHKSHSPSRQQAEPSMPASRLFPRLQPNLRHIRQVLGNSGDLIIREFPVGPNARLNAAILYTDGLVDAPSVQSFILESLMTDLDKAELEKAIRTGRNVLHYLKDHALTVSGIQPLLDCNKLFNALLSGSVIFLLDGYDEGFAIDLSKHEHRQVSEPAVESVVRGPREGFTENLRINTALVRRKIKDRNLWMENRTIGTVTQTEVAVMYIRGIVNGQIVEEVRARLDRIDIDGILESGYIEELIQDETFTPFPTIYNTERPDVIAAELLEGKVAIFVDGTPFVLIVPALFVSFLHSAEDYYQRADISTLLRMIRYVGFFTALLAPSLYIAITTFHQEMLPTQLLISLAAQREGIPFPAFIEALMMEITFEILREAGLRMPRAIGQAVSVVGTLVIGQAAVEAGIVSAAMVIVVSITAISSFVFPAVNMSISIRMLRFPLMILAATFGLFGTIFGLLALVLHLCSLRSFGVPYMSPFAPFHLEEQKDTIFRLPLWMMRKRPRSIRPRNAVRQQPAPAPKSRPKPQH